MAKFSNHQPEPGVEALVSYMRKLLRDVPAGTRWLYSTGETNPVGTLVQQTTKSPSHLAEKVWGPAGMEQQATWLLSKTGKEIGGCCVQASPRDYARLGVFILNGAQVNGQSIVPEGWWAEATTKRADISRPGAACLPVHLADVTAAMRPEASSVRASSSTPTQAGDRVRTPTGPGAWARPQATEARENFNTAKWQVIDEEARRCAHKVGITSAGGPYQAVRWSADAPTAPH